MKIFISSGHGLHVRGARGNPVPPQLDERDENVRVVDRVAEELRTLGVTVGVYHDNTSTSQNQNLNSIVAAHNGFGAHELDISVHFNAFDHSAQGTEVLYVTQQSLASKVSSAICSAGKFTNRGAKKRTDLAFLNGTNAPAILVETCFCDNTSDSNKYNANFAAICKAIASSASGIGAPVEPPTEPVEPPIEPPTQPPASSASVSITTTGPVTVIVNGQTVSGGAEAAGDIPFNQRDITATVFGGASDPNDSAYPPYDALNDSDLYCALPANITDEAMRRRGVRVYNRATGKDAVGAIRDKGPWLVDDDAYVFGDAVSLAVSCFKSGTPLPRGPNAGKVPTNDAAIDLSPALARAIGISGKGKVDWEWIT